MQGIFELKTSDDLYQKMKRDYALFESDKNNSDLSYNFFVTAWHLLEWTYPNDKPKQKSLRSDNLVLQICEHLAVGAKHFEPIATKHNTVESSDLVNTMISRDFFAKGFFGKGFFDERLVVNLGNEAKSEFGAIIEAFDLARHVKDFWDQHLLS